MFNKTHIFGSNDVKTKKQDLLHSKKRTYPRIQSNLEVYCLQKKIVPKVFFFGSNSFYELSLFPPGNPFDPIQPTFPY